MSRRVDVLSERQIAERAIFRLVETHLQHERYDGAMSEELVRITFERGNSAAAVLHDATDDSVILIEQFRYPTFKSGGGWILELPAGIIETDDDGGRDLTIRQELLEEVGYQVESLVSVMTFYLSPGASSERLFLYYGSVQAMSKVARGGGNPGEGEDIRTVVVPLDTALDKIASGAIVDAKTIVGLQWIKLKSLQSQALGD